MGRNATKRYVDGIQISPAMDPLVIGDWGDKRPTREQILAVVSILKDAGISCCFVQEFGLIYYGAARVLNVFSIIHLLIDKNTDRFENPILILEPNFMCP